VYFAFILDDLAFLSDDNDGLEIVNISDPTNPWKMGGFNDGGHTRNLFVDYNLVFLTDLDDGLEILELTTVPPTQNPNVPTEIVIATVISCSIPVIIGSLFFYRRLHKRNGNRIIGK
jgi:hypothetical protein